MDESAIPNRTCIACGDPVTRHRYRGRMVKRYVYCGARCFREKPIEVVEIELMYAGRAERRPQIHDILIETGRTFPRMDDWAQALHVSLPYLYTMLERYFQIRAPHPITGEMAWRPMEPDEFRAAYLNGAGIGLPINRELDAVRGALAQPNEVAGTGEFVQHRHEAFAAAA